MSKLNNILYAVLIAFLPGCRGCTVEVWDEIPANLDATVFQLPIHEGMKATRVVTLWNEGLLDTYIAAPPLADDEVDTWMERIENRDQGSFFWKVKPHFFGDKRQEAVLIPYYRVWYSNNLVTRVEISANRVLSPISNAE